MYIYIYIIYKYTTYLVLKTMIVHNNIKHMNAIGLAAAKAPANPIVQRGLYYVVPIVFWASYVIHLYNI